MDAKTLSELMPIGKTTIVDLIAEIQKLKTINRDLLKALKKMLALRRGEHEPTTEGMIVMNARGVIALAEAKP